MANVFVTGANGFVGMALCRHLMNRSPAVNRECQSALSSELPRIPPGRNYVDEEQHMRWTVMAVAAVMAALMSVGANGAPPAERNGPCAEDARRLCPNAKPGSKELRECMKKQEAHVSAACRENAAKAKARVHEAKEACAGDVERFCKGVKPGEGRVVGCLRKNEAQLTEACRATMKEKPKQSPKQAPTQTPAPAPAPK